MRSVANLNLLRLILLIYQFDDYTNLTQMSQFGFNILDDQEVQRIVKEHLKAQQTIYTKIAADEIQTLSKKLQSKGIRYDSQEHLIFIQKMIDKKLLVQSGYIHDNFIDRIQIHKALKACIKVKSQQRSLSNKIKELIEQIIQEIQTPLIQQFQQKIVKYIDEMQINERISSLPEILIEEEKNQKEISQLTSIMNQYDLIYSESLLSFSQFPAAFVFKPNASGKNKKAS